jgi:steroid 5-alpha reductase family enzyme
LALPAILMAQNTATSLSVIEIIGASLWAIWFVLEHVSDMQKQQFLKKSFLEKKKKQVCNAGFWKYSRHPNYFAEWMVWNSMILSAFFSYTTFYSQDKLFDDYGIITLMYHRFEENKYPSTNIQIQDFVNHIKMIKKSI